MNKKSLSLNKKGDREDIIAILRSGRIVAGASDTVPGLLAPATQAGKRSLNIIKQRKNKPYVLLIASKNVLFSLIDADQLLHIEKIVDQCWPGPLTLILKALSRLPLGLQSETGTIAVRIPRHTGLLKVLEGVSMLFSTSANRAGKPLPATIGDIDQTIKQQVAALVHNGPTLSQPSTIIDCTQSVPRLVREGAYSLNKLEKRTGIAIQR